MKVYVNIQTCHIPYKYKNKNKYAEKFSNPRVKLELPFHVNN